ncbi:MAG: phytoene desaturase [Chitinophagaceae bacterium]|nr:MAG: phytoene desaturase [Chitinophagaceae bacterium]
MPISDMDTIVIGSGFAGLSAACFLARAGKQVLVLEKNSTPGGRARSFAAEGFLFDMGPSWYWMPDVFDRFFSQFGYQTSDFYSLKRLDPSYRVFWEDGTDDIPADISRLTMLFESIEPGAGKKLELFLEEASRKYELSMKSLVYNPCLSALEFCNRDVLGNLASMDLFTSMHKHLRRFFRHPKLLQLTEFPILFLGALPENTPALYSLMNYADMKLGTWYPEGGMQSIAGAMYGLALELGVKFRFDAEVTGIGTKEQRAVSVHVGNEAIPCSDIIFSCDYQHAESLLSSGMRNYSAAYWEKKKMAPSCVLFYLGINKKVAGLEHHNLFFDAPFAVHAEALYKKAAHPDKPLIYICCTSKTDTSTAPEGSENLFVLIPVAPGLSTEKADIDRYFDEVVERIAFRTGVSIRDHVVYRRDYCASDFELDYNAFKGNAYGLANTLDQTAIFKPSIRNKKLKNLFYTGQLTVPGPGVPPAIISGEIVANQVVRRSAKIKTVY